MSQTEQLVKIFEVEDNVVKVSEACLLIPELRAIVEKYDNPIPPLTYLRLLVAPDSPYANLDEEERQQLASEDAGGDFSLEDEEIDAAIVKLKKIMYTRTQRLHAAAGNNLDKISKYLDEAEIDGSGRDGNLGELYRIQINLPKLMENYNKLTKMAAEEQSAKLRGSAQAGMY